MGEISKPSSTLATARVDRLIGRALSAGAVLFSLEGFANFYAQLPLLNQSLAWSVMGVLWATTLSYVVTFWFGSANYLYLRIHAIYAALLPLFWPLIVQTNPSTDGSFDIANSQRTEAAILEAQVEAQAKERARLDALVHDSVLTALISAGGANSAEETKASAELATLAIERLQNAEDTADRAADVLCSALFDSVISAVQRIDPAIEFKKTCLTSVTVSGEVASALTEATIQAVHNSLLHAGAKARRELHLKSTNGNLKIVVVDDGLGFRPNRLPRGRLGIKLSIHGRMENVGGKAHIASAPRKGTTVVLEWSQA
ncbi:MAG: hypothetical protein EB057_01630 [Microbacteriaceae bacterium]|nr:hypothetical protein [Microbacteriaceae bacterium]